MRDEERHCCLCHHECGGEDAAILTMGHYGNPRYLCADCASVLDTVTESRDTAELRGAMGRLAQLLAASATDDTAVIETVEDILARANTRSDELENGTYVESEDEDASPDGFDEIPEELRETEEDRLIDEQEAEDNKRFDRIWTWVMLAVCAVAVVLLVLRFTVFRR